ncbi:hypothetical protein Daesc_004827 [Daldinia eschscholtzii]|uniref:Heterokaryon incompatibility domain-containing protein n=1 Tax=Daldinia eschscholtzii TaxID=292717 RepID=A0AAX6MQE7_9PEZI
MRTDQAQKTSAFISRSRIIPRDHLFVPLSSLLRSNPLIMRLIDVKTLKLKEFFGQDIPPYAILSHTWKGNTEVTFEEWERAAVDDAVKYKDGYAKIVAACSRVHDDGLQYLWCDTNCIDKSSSAELSEAINSMFAWYRDSTVCYAYLHDVKTKDTFAQSRWFTRGWTLQELLAPSKVLFFNRCWTVLGDRSELAEVISGITRIHVDALKNRSTIYDYSIAQRMSWAADRQTTRSEDIAYCLLGIFDINMPLLYGEGPKAFTRLQREIIKVSDDQSILAWDSRYSDDPPLSSVLAPSPAEFRFCGSIVRDPETQCRVYSVTNLGISMNLALIETFITGLVMVGLNCAVQLQSEGGNQRLGNCIKLRRHFRIWIPLCHSRHQVYVRSHLPASKILLHKAYPIFSRPSLTDLFLCLDIRQIAIPQSPEVPQKVLHHSPHLHSGIVVTISSGQLMPLGDIFSEVYPLNNISIVPLKRQGVSTMSHLLISSGSLSVIISVFWNTNGLPEGWQHTTIFDPNLQTTSQMASQAEWACFFDSNRQYLHTKCCNNTFSMHSLHRKLKEACAEKMSTYMKEGKDPVVTVENKPLRDMFGLSHIVVHVIFRESPNLIDCKTALNRG